MKISDMQEWLEEIKSKEGDIEVSAETEYGDSPPCWEYYIEERDGHLVLFFVP